MTWRAAALVAVLSGGVAAALVAQRAPARWDGDQWQHVAAGAAVALAVRGPWIAPAWRDAWWKRGVWQLMLGGVWELAQWDRFRHLDTADAGQDLAADVLGWAVVELGAAAWKAVR